MHKIFPFVLGVAVMAMLAPPTRALQINQYSTLTDRTPPAYVPPKKAPETHFDAAIDDLPLMPGLSEDEDKSVLFKTPGGRIAESTAEGEVDIDDVYKFYRRTLPHLGWKAVDGRTYDRRGEQLFIEARADGKLATVRFTVKPVPSGKDNK